MSDFEFPEYYSFPPFFTIQPVSATRQKQLALWRDLILKYHTANKEKTLVVHDCTLWKNEGIQRELNRDNVRLICEDFVNNGNGEWEDEAKTRIRIMWKKPEELAGDLLAWADRSGFKGQVCTLYELSSGEDSEGASFEGADEELIRRALAILEERGQVAIFKGDTSEEDGVKFF
ncbi:hypothetical protein TrVE_jg13791 [Triparma verrucosa]|uniref:ESCRT-II complex subunit VPS25 n=2 Tax=Triparma TaxID=722752 RepID=A0A9W7B5M2_9STRA|nr:hypothetical protein TrST_g1321 [Triparma strigata]GMI02589.1 hypothetical protein TrVE_jg13791 [Triparma verrucosa]